MVLPLLITAILAILFCLDPHAFYIFDHPHFIFLWDKMPALHSLFGFIGCVLIIVVSKALGHYWLMKEEDYYEKRR